MGQKRNASIEWLRIISCLFIIMIHLWAPIRTELSFPNQVLSMAINSLCNIGVSCFILISGYFGVRLNWKKIVLISTITSGYALLSFTVRYLTSLENMTVGGVIKAAFPVFFNQNWYICCYLALMILSPFLNRLLESCSIKQHFLLCGSLILIFSVIPTFFYYELPGTEHKGLWHMILMYTIGRLIARTDGWRNVRDGKLILGFFTGLGLTIMGNVGVLLLTHVDKGYFYRDCSLFIILTAVMFFLLFAKRTAKGKAISFVSKYCLDVYLIHDALIIKLLNQYVFSLERYVNSPKLILFILLEWVLCFVLSWCAAFVLHPLFKIIGQFIYKAFAVIGRRLEPLLKGRVQM